MVACAVLNCKNAHSKTLGYFRFPAILTRYTIHSEGKSRLSEIRRRAWLRAIRRKDLFHSKLQSERVCSSHFISGRPAQLSDVENPDWIPTQNMGYDFEAVLKKDIILQKYLSLRVHEAFHSLIKEPQLHAIFLQADAKKENGDDLNVDEKCINHDVEIQGECDTTSVSVSTQTTMTTEDVNNLAKDLFHCQEENKKLKMLIRQKNRSLNGLMLQLMKRQENQLRQFS